jgi:eukaryotic-like serine/threonine-protein kinase
VAGPGELIAGRYRIVRPLGSGGLGRVWLAEDERLHFSVAIKKCAMPDGLNRAEQALVRTWTVKEARAAARVRHPNVVRILDVLPGDDHPWTVMEYVPSRSLLDVINESGPLPPDEAARIGLAVLHGLQAAARAGVRHLDVKPSNVLIADDGRVVLTDFGPAVTEEGVRALSGAGIVLGSPNYVAPERLADRVGSDRADLWSLGATMYHAVEGRPPYRRETTAAVLQAITDGSPDRPHRAGRLTPVLEGLLQRDPADRMGPAEVEERLNRLADERHAVEPRPSRPIRQRLAVVAAAAAVLAVVGVAAASAERSGTSTGGTGAGAPAPASAAAPPIPADFRWWNDPSGFRVAVPRQWAGGDEGSGGALFRAPDGLSILRVRPAPAGGGSPLDILLTEERAAGLAGYKRIGMDPVSGTSDMVWNYTYRDAQARPLRAQERVVVRGGRTYLIEWRTPRAAWAANLSGLDVVVTTFRPPPGT